MPAELTEANRADRGDDSTTVAELRQLVEDFVAERDWSRYHSPKNLAMAIEIEASELMEHYQWLDPAEPQATLGPPPARASAPRPPAGARRFKPSS